MVFPSTFTYLLKDRAVSEICGVYIAVEVENAEASDAADSDKDNSQRRRSKKSKVVASKFQLDKAVSDLIKQDDQNRKLWDDVLLFVEEGHQVTVRCVRNMYEHSTLCISFYEALPGLGLLS